MTHGMPLSDQCQPMSSFTMVSPKNVPSSGEMCLRLTETALTNSNDIKRQNPRAEQQLRVRSAENRPVAPRAGVSGSRSAPPRDGRSRVEWVAYLRGAGHARSSSAGQGGNPTDWRDAPLATPTRAGLAGHCECKWGFGL